MDLLCISNIYLNIFLLLQWKEHVCFHYKAQHVSDTQILIHMLWVMKHLPFVMKGI